MRALGKFSTGNFGIVFRRAAVGVEMAERSVDFRGERGDEAGVEAVDPAVDGDFLAAFPCVFENGGLGDMAGLGKHVEFAKPIRCGFRRECIKF